MVGKEDLFHTITTTSTVTSNTGCRVHVLGYTGAGKDGGFLTIDQSGADAAAFSHQTEPSHQIKPQSHAIKQ